MKNRKLIRVLAIICALMMLMMAFVGCKKKNQGTEESGTTGVIDTSGLDSEATNNLPTQQDFGGYQYRMLVQDSSADHLQYYLSKDGMAGDSVSIALYAREVFMESYFNITLTVEGTESGENVNSTIDKDQQAGDDNWDAISQVASVTHTGGVIKGLYLDLYQVPGLKLDATYWDQRIQQGYTLNGALFAIEGDFTILDELRTNGVLYNRNLYEEFNYDDTYGSLYELVRSGKWTYATMIEMFKGKSLSDTGVPTTANDRWGMISTTTSPYIFLMGSGKSMVRNVNGSTQLVFDDTGESQYIQDAYDNIIKTLVQDTNEVLFADTWKVVSSWDDASNMFKTDKALFRNSTLLDATWLSDMKSEFGILPIPKYDESQDGYYSYVDTASHAPLSIPRTAVEHIETTGAITEALCYFSRYTVDGSVSLYDSFYEKMTVAKLCRSQDDYEMLELIYASKMFDIDSVFNITKFLNLGVSSVTGRPSGGSTTGGEVKYTGAGSSIASIKSMAQTNFDTYMNAVIDSTLQIGQ